MHNDYILKNIHLHFVNWFGHLDMCEINFIDECTILLENVALHNFGFRMVFVSIGDTWKILKRLRIRNAFTVTSDLVYVLLDL